MYPHALIIAALSASALAEYSLTAYDHTDSSCTGKAIGNYIVLSGSPCTLYQPEQPDAYIKATWAPGSMNYYRNITIFSDTDCENEIASFGIDSAADKDEDCLSMSDIAGGPWGSAKIGAES